MHEAPRPLRNPRPIPEPVPLVHVACRLVVAAAVFWFAGKLLELWLA